MSRHHSPTRRCATRRLRGLVLAVYCVIGSAVPVVAAAKSVSAAPMCGSYQHPCPTGSTPLVTPTVAILPTQNAQDPTQWTLNVEVTGTSAGTPTGTVTLTGATLTGASPITSAIKCTIGNTCDLSPSTTSDVTTALATVQGLTPGTSYQFTATYKSDNSIYGTASTQQTVHVAATINIASSTSLVISPAQVTYGGIATLTATVTDANGPVTSGTVKFLNVTANTTLGPSPVPLSSDGTATLTVTGWTTSGTYTLRAEYLGTDLSSHQDASISVTGPPAVLNTTTALSIDPAQIAIGGLAGLTATVTDANGPVTNGIVKFVNADAGTTLGTAILGSNGVATLRNVTGWTTAGTYDIQAMFEGTATDSSSVTADLLPVISKPVATTTSASANPATVVADNASPVVLKATVTAPAPSVGASGTVDFFVDGQDVGQATLSGGVATLDYSAKLTSGPHAVTAQYNGDSGNQPSTSSPVTLTADTVIDTTTTGSATPSPQLAGRPVTLTATVANSGGAGGSPTGSVDFTSSSLPGSTLCTASLASSGLATCTTTLLPAGSNPIVASYGGDKTHTGSTGAFVATVVLNATQTALTASPSLAAAGQSVTLTAAVTGVDPTGTVTFTSGGVALCSNVPLTAGSAQCATTGLLVPGDATVMAAYSGDANNAVSSATTSVTVVPPVIDCGETWHPWIQPPQSALNLWGNCEWFLQNWSGDWNNYVAPGGTINTLYNDEAALGTGTNAPSAVVLHNGIPTEVLPVTVTPETNGAGHDYYYGSGYNDGTNGSGSRTVDLLSVSVPANLSAGDVVQLTAYDAEGDVDQVSWTVFTGRGNNGD